nr:serine protease inhibitor ecotin [uncultured Moellerella sp.]
MKKTIFPLMAAVLMSSYAIADGQLEKIAPYPKAEAGMTRNVIELQPKENEDNYKVELVIGKTLKVDCNRQWFMGELESKDLEGWGYNYYRLEEVKGPASTMMGCADQAKTEKFITTNLGDDAFVRYNSKLPIVVYAPKDMAVKYRIWSAEDTLADAVNK